MDMDEDDPMEIDDSVPATAIIERKSDEFAVSQEETVSNIDKPPVESTYDNTIVNTEKPKEKKAVKPPVESTYDNKVNTEKPKEKKAVKPPVESTYDKVVNTEKPKEKKAVKPPVASTFDNKVIKTEKPQEKKAEEADVVILDDDDEVPDIKPVLAKSGAKSSSNNSKLKNVKMKTTMSPTTSSATIPVKEIIDLVEKPHASSRCLNPTCEGKSSQFFSAADFCLSYYRVKRTKSHKEEICLECYNRAVKDFDNLATTLLDGGLILEVDYPVINETLQIDDSDEEDEEMGEIDYIDEENFQFISDHFTDIIASTLKKVNIEERLLLETDYVEKKAKNSTDNHLEVNKSVREIRNQLDNIQLDLYNYFGSDSRALKGLNIIDDTNLASHTIIRVDYTTESPRKSTRSHKAVSYVELDDGGSNSPTVATPAPQDKPQEPEVPVDLPPIGTIERPTPQVGENYYIVRENSQGSWIRARLLQIVPPNTSINGLTYNQTMYRLIELKQQKERLLNGKSMAYLTFARVRLPVGTRVISVFKELNNVGDGKKPRHDPYYAGVVAEQPFDGNKYRYLIFFDIGYSQYVSYHCVNLLILTSPNVWEDVYIDCRPFIKKYLESQDRPMVKLAKDQTVRVEYNAKWWLCTVTSVDCSLVQVFFDALSRTEWIYRGSTRLSPMFREEQNATSRQSGVRARKLGANESAAVVQYTRNADFVHPTESEPSSAVRAVARKSTTKPQGNIPTPNIVPFLPPVNNTPPNTTGPTSKIMYFTPRDQVIIKRKLKIHECSVKCKEFLTHNFSQLKGHNPLSKPLLCGWGRVTSKAKGRKEIMYKAPCGRLLRDIAEVHMYLRTTESEMTVDLFDFNHMVRCLAEFSVECNPDPKDLSRGLEQVPIPVINGINNEMLDFCNYSIKRVPMEGVMMNLDHEFLCGCDCDDDCIDKTKCACWQLTLEGAKYIGKDVDPNSVGYIYRRLPEQVITGIYECNPRCKCSQTCLNRVVQNPMTLKLQVFKTINRGWGIRCLNDVPQGSFICIYAGTIHTEAMANEDGVAYGDEYFAELDYIETVEKFKEDYEAEAMEDDDDDEETGSRGKSPVEEEEDDEEADSVPQIKQPFTGKKRYNYSEDNDFLPSHNERVRIKESGIRTRLRKRNIEEDSKDAKETVSPSPIRPEIKVKQEIIQKDVKPNVDALSEEIETVTISDEEDEGREVLSFNPKGGMDEKSAGHPSVRELFGSEECVYVMDAKNAGNIGRFLNHSCSPNVFVQNVFVDTHDPRFPWVSFFSSQFIRAGTELTWNYNYDIGSVPGRVLYCHCASLECKGRLL